MGLSVVISYPTTFPSISGDVAPSLMTETNILFQSMLENIDFGINLSFLYMTNDEVPQQVSISSISMIGPTGTYYTNSGSNVSITGNLSGFFDEKWDFVMRDRSIKRLPINNTEDWIAVSRWHPASMNQLILNYNFSINLVTNSVVSMNIPQYIYWKWQPSLTKLKQYVAQGEI